MKSFSLLLLLVFALSGPSLAQTDPDLGPQRRSIGRRHGADPPLRRIGAQPAEGADRAGVAQRVEGERQPGDDAEADGPDRSTDELVGHDLLPDQAADRQWRQRNRANCHDEAGRGGNRQPGFCRPG